MPLSKYDARTGKVNPYALGVFIWFLASVAVRCVSKGDQRSGTKSAALWRGASSCVHCDFNDQVVSFPITVPNSGTLSPATGNVPLRYDYTPT